MTETREGPKRDALRIVVWALLAFALTMALRLVLYALLGYAPFGSLSVASEDANVQYLDFYSYFQDVLAGKASLAYSFGKGLGGNMTGVAAYYLSSPLSLLSALFERDQLPAFFDLAVALKTSLASASMYVFLALRLCLSDERDERQVLAVLLGTCYGLSQFCLAQSSNVMWFDGVAFLPLYLLLIHRIVAGERGWGLAVVVGLSIVANWYTAGMNCIFAFLWFAFELLLAWAGSDRGMTARVLARRVARFLLALACGLLLSGVLFVPMVLAMRGSTRGGMDLSLLRDLAFFDDPSSLVSGYTYGTICVDDYRIALFSGCLPAIGCAALPFAKMGRRRKAVLFGMLACGALMVYWRPLYVVFSFFKSVNGYYCRYGYLVVAILVFVGGTTLLEKPRLRPSRLVAAAALFAAGVLATSFLTSNQSLNIPSDFVGLRYLAGASHHVRACQTAVAALVWGLALAACARCFSAKEGTAAGVVTPSGPRLLPALLRGALVVLCAVDLGYNACLILWLYHAENAVSYGTYERETTDQVAAVRAYDDGAYRMLETSNRESPRDQRTEAVELALGVSANYNEPLAYGYASLSTYTSAPDGRQMDLLDALGYPFNEPNMCAVDMPIIATDALFGVRYVLSSYPVEGMTHVDGVGTYNGKDVYENPYSLPLAFTVPSSAGATVADGAADTQAKELLGGDPFENQEALYTALLGHDANLYEPLVTSVTRGVDADAGVTYVLEAELPSGNRAFYGNVVFEEAAVSTLDVNGAYRTPYSDWLTPSVFAIPGEGGSAATLTLTSETSVDLDASGVQLYGLDLDAMRSASEELSSRAAQLTTFEDGLVEATVTEGHAGESLYLSVPYDAGWAVERNGEAVDAELIANCCYVVPLKDGENVVRLTYRVPGLGAGIAATACGVALLAGLYVVDGRRRRREEEMA